MAELWAKGWGIRFPNSLFINLACMFSSLLFTSRCPNGQDICFCFLGCKINPLQMYVYSYTEQCTVLVWSQWKWYRTNKIPAGHRLVLLEWTLGVFSMFFTIPTETRMVQGCPACAQLCLCTWLQRKSRCADIVTASHVLVRWQIRLCKLMLDGLYTATNARGILCEE